MINHESTKFGLRLFLIEINEIVYYFLFNIKLSALFDSRKEEDLMDSFDDDLIVTRKHHLVGMRNILHKEH